MTKRLLAAAALLSAVSFGGSANAGCLAPDVCYGNVVLLETCVKQPTGPCVPVVVEAPLCWGGSMWTGGICSL